MDIVTLGELLVDMFPAELGRPIGEVSAFQPKPGGAPANVAVAAARLSVEAAFIGKVGDDAFGYHLIDVLEQEGVEARGVQVDDYARTTMAFIAKPDEDSAEFVFYRNPGADTRLEPDELDHDLLQAVKVFHFGSLSLTNEPARSATLEAIKLARAGGALVSYDVNYRPSLWPESKDALECAESMLSEVDLLKVNETELALLAGKERVEQDAESLGTAAKILLEQGPTLCIVTLGANGSFFQIETGGAYIPPFKVKTVDAVGCGDAFVAGLLSQLIEGEDWRAHLAVDRLKQVLRYANAVGALTALTQGVIPALPTAAQVEEFLAERTK